MLRIKIEKKIHKDPSQNSPGKKFVSVQKTIQRSKDM